MYITRYTSAEKKAALDCLRRNGGNVAQTSTETGVPERTLYSWRRKEMQRPPVAPPAIPADLDLDDADALIQLRRQIMAYVADLGPSLVTGLDLLTPYQRALTVRQLLEQLSLIDSLIPAHARENVTRVEFVNPDGSVSDKPFWMQNRDT